MKNRPTVLLTSNYSPDDQLVTHIGADVVVAGNSIWNSIYEKKCNEYTWYYDECFYGLSSRKYSTYVTTKIDDNHQNGMLDISDITFAQKKILIDEVRSKEDKTNFFKYIDSTLDDKAAKDLLDEIEVLGISKSISKRLCDFLVEFRNFSTVYGANYEKGFIVNQDRIYFIAGSSVCDIPIDTSYVSDVNDKKTLIICHSHPGRKVLEYHKDKKCNINYVEVPITDPGIPSLFFKFDNGGNFVNEKGDLRTQYDNKKLENILGCVIGERYFSTYILGKCIAVYNLQDNNDSYFLIKEKRENTDDIFEDKTNSGEISKGKGELAGESIAYIYYMKRKIEGTFFSFIEKYFPEMWGIKKLNEHSRYYYFNVTDEFKDAIRERLNSPPHDVTLKIDYFPLKIDAQKERNNF